MRRVSRTRLLAGAVMLGLSLAGCDPISSGLVSGVHGDENAVQVYFPESALCNDFGPCEYTEKKASEHCAAYGKRARFINTVRGPYVPDFPYGHQAASTHQYACRREG